MEKLRRLYKDFDKAFIALKKNYNIKQKLGPLAWQRNSELGNQIVMVCQGIHDQLKSVNKFYDSDGPFSPKMRELIDALFQKRFIPQFYEQYSKPRLLSQGFDEELIENLEEEVAKRINDFPLVLLTPFVKQLIFMAREYNGGLLKILFDIDGIPGKGIEKNKYEKNILGKYLTRYLRMIDVRNFTKNKEAGA